MKCHNWFAVSSQKCILLFGSFKRVRRFSLIGFYQSQLRYNHESSLNKSTYDVPRIKKTLDDDLSNFNFITHILNPWVEKQPNHPALWMTDGKSAVKSVYVELFNQSRNLSLALSKGNLSPKCGIVILPKVQPWWIINLSGSWCEMSISPGTPMLSESDIIYRIKTSKADAIFGDASIMHKVDEKTRHLPWRILVEGTKEEEVNKLRPGWLSYHQLLEEGEKLEFVPKQYKGDSIAQLFFTSGTTGYPKMVPHTQKGYGLGHVPTARDWLNLQPTDLVWNLSDLGWAKAAFSSFYAPLIAGSTIFVHQAARFDSREVLNTLENEPITTLCLPPTALRALIQEDLSSFKPKSLKIVTSAGEPLNPEVIHTWHKYTGIMIREGYGQTESTVMCCSHNGVKVKPGSMGKPTGSYDMKILDDDLKELKNNEIGQLAISLKNNWPDGLFSGYYDKERNAKAFVSDYFLTGDRGFLDEEGYICYVGRTDDIIISAGYRIGPYEVESALLKHPAVVESGVVGSPDYKRGHVVKAFIILTEEYKAKIQNEEFKFALVKELQEFIKNSVSPYKYPRKIQFVDSLPKTVSGKIQRVKLRQQEIDVTKK